MGSLKGKTILITGASRGIGAAIAERCAKDGANLVIAAKTLEPHPKLPGTILETAEIVEKAGGQALPLQVDVRDEGRVHEVVDETVKKFGGIDVLINNAGAIILEPTEILASKRYNLMMDINVRAVFLLAQACIPHLKKSENGHILNMSPPVSTKPMWFENHTAYTISKFSMSMFTIGLSAELKGAGVAANSLWPKTTIATAAVNMLGGEPMMKASRTPEIMADAAYEIITSPSKECTGNHFVDEDLLRDRGSTEFDKYAVDPSQELQPDFFLEHE